MALPFLPAEKIQRRFDRLQRQAATEGLKRFASYVADNWVTSRTFPLATWSVYMEPIRKNNNLEGWHNGLNRRAKGKSQLPLYLLIQLLHKESSLVSFKSDLCPREDYEDIKERLTRTCRRGCLVYGMNTKHDRKTQNSFWKPALIWL